MRHPKKASPPLFRLKIESKFDMIFSFAQIFMLAGGFEPGLMISEGGSSAASPLCIKMKSGCGVLKVDGAC